MSGQLIPQTFGFDDDLTQIDYQDLATMRQLLLGHRVEKVASDHIRLDNGYIVKVVPNEGCGGCSAGNYYITELNHVDNVITAVDVVVSEAVCNGS